MASVVFFFFSPRLASDLERIQVSVWALSAQRVGRDGRCYLGSLTAKEVFQRSLQSTADHPPKRQSFLSCNHVSFKEKRSL